MVITKSVLGACAVLLACAGAGAGGFLSQEAPDRAAPQAKSIAGHPPAVDMSRLQFAFAR